MIPVVLALPSILRYADTRQGLTSLALLGRGDTSSVDTVDENHDKVDRIFEKKFKCCKNLTNTSYGP